MPKLGNSFLRAKGKREYDESKKSPLTKRFLSFGFVHIRGILYNLSAREDFIQMNYKKPDKEKLYYSIGEVAGMFDVSRSLIRFWENEFDFLKPVKNTKGERRFTQKNLDQLSIIYHLVKERGFTLAGAKHEIATRKKRLMEKSEHLKRLKEIRKTLIEIRDSL